MGEKDNVIPEDADWQYLEEMYLKSLKESSEPPEDAYLNGLPEGNARPADTVYSDADGGGKPSVCAEVIPSGVDGGGELLKAADARSSGIGNGGELSADAGAQDIGDLGRSVNASAPAFSRSGPARADVGDVIEALGKELGLLKEQVGRIRGFDDIQRMYDELSLKISKIEASGQYVDRMSEKVDSILAELDKRIPELLDVEEKTRSLQDVTSVMRKSVERDEAVLKGAVYKDDFERLAEDVERRTKRFEDEAEDSARKLDEFGKSFLELEKRIEFVSALGDKVAAMEAKLDRVAGAVMAIDSAGAKDLVERVRILEEGTGFQSQVRAQAAQQPVSADPDLEKRLHELERSSRQTRDFLARERGFEPEKRMQANILAEELHRFTAKVGGLVERGKLHEAKEAYLKIWEAYTKLNAACEDRRMVEPLYRDIMHLRRIIYGEENSEQVVAVRPGAPASADGIKSAVSRAVALADAGRVREAGEAYVGLVEQYSKLKGEDKKAAEAAYSYLDFLYKTLEMKKSGVLK